MAGLYRVNVISDSYGRWWYNTTSNDGSVGSNASVGPFADRRLAIESAREDYPDADLRADGVTVGASKPLDGPPTIDRDEERRRAGLRPLSEINVPVPPMATAPSGAVIDPPAGGGVEYVPPAPAAAAPRHKPEARKGMTQTEVLAPAPEALPGEPRSYGQGRRFEDAHGKKAGELGGPDVPVDPLARAQSQSAAMREAVERVKSGA